MAWSSPEAKFRPRVPGNQPKQFLRLGNPCNYDVAKAELDTTEPPFWPTVNIEVDGRHSENTEGRKGHERELQALAVLSYNLYNGGSDVSRQKEITETIAESRFRLDQAQRSAKRETQISWAELKSALNQEVKLRKSVAAKDKVRKIFLQQFDLNLRSLLDLLDSENDFFLATGSLITVDATADLTGLRLLSAMGVMLFRLDLRQEPIEDRMQEQPEVIQADFIREKMESLPPHETLVMEETVITQEDIGSTADLTTPPSSFTQIPANEPRTPLQPQLRPSETATTAVNYGGDESSFGIEIPDQIESGASIGY